MDNPKKKRMGKAFTAIVEGVDKQPHYTQFNIQPVVFIESNNLGFSQGEVIKYVCRYKKKNGVEDLKKAIHQLEILIRKEETGEVKP